VAKLVSPVWAIRRSGFVNWLSAKGSILQVLIIGIQNGAILSLVGLGIALVYKATTGAKTNLILDLTGYFR